jgi:hypothetical protein
MNFESSRWRSALKPPYEPPPPPSLGQFMEDIIEARGLTLQEVSNASGIPITDLELMISNDKDICEKDAESLDIVFPDAAHILIGVQRNHLYFIRHRNWRPRSFVARISEGFVDFFAV